MFLTQLTITLSLKYESEVLGDKLVINLKDREQVFTQVGEMKNITAAHLSRAINKIAFMPLEEKSELADEIFISQPVLLSSILVQKKLGNSYEQVEVLINILLTIYEAMKEAKITIHSISQAEYERQMMKTVAQIKFSERMNKELLGQSVDQYIEHHPDKFLFAYITNEMVKFGFHDLKHESSGFLLLTGINLAACIAEAINKA